MGRSPKHFSDFFLALGPEPEADLSVSNFTDLPDPVDELQTLSYLARATNAADSPATVVGAQIFVGVVGDVVFSGSSGLCSASSPTISLYDLEIRCTMGSLAPGSLENVRIDVTPQSPGTLQATAFVFPPFGITDTNGANDSQGPITTTVLSSNLLADVRVSHFADLTDPIDEGEVLTYAAQVNNAADSEGPVAGMTLFVGVVGDVTYDGASASCSASSPTISLYDLEIRCPVSSLAPAAFEDFAIRVVPRSPGTLEATAILFLPLGVTDTEPDNNEVGPVSTTVLSANLLADLRVSHFADLTDPIDEHHVLTYAVRVNNTADSEGTVSGLTLFVGITGDVAYDGPPECSATSPSISLYDLEVRCPVPTLGLGTEADFAIRVIPGSAGTVEATAIVLLPSGVTDTDPSNNEVGPISTTVLSVNRMADIYFSAFQEIADPVEVGQLASYLVAVQNDVDSRDEVSGVTLFVGVNGDVAFSAPTVCSPSTPTVSLYDLEIRCVIDALSPGDGEVFLISVTPLSPGSVEVRAAILLPAGATDTDGTNNQTVPLTTTVIGGAP